MKKFSMLMLIAGMFVLTGCNALDAAKEQTEASPASSSATVTLKVLNLKKTAEAIAAIPAKSGGYLQQSVWVDDNQLTFTLRVPAEQFLPTLDAVEKLGTPSAKSITNISSGEILELQRRIEQLKQYEQTLALKIKDTKAADYATSEKELKRVKGDIAVLEAQISNTKDQFPFATIKVSLEKDFILGPAGLVLKYSFWLVEKLFVLNN